MAQSVKNLPATQKTRVQSLGWEDALEEKMATHSSVPAWKTHGQRSLVDYSPWGSKESDSVKRHDLVTNTFTFLRHTKRIKPVTNNKVKQSR